MRYEIIENGQTVNIIEADESFMSANFQPGSYVLSEFQPSPDVVPQTEAPPIARHITKLAFRQRFTQSERVAIEIAQLDDPTAPMAQRAQAAALRSSQADLMVASYVDLDRADTIAGVQMLESAGLIGVGRADTILTTAVTDVERYRA
jgi:hypothetical protein